MLVPKGHTHKAPTQNRNRWPCGLVGPIASLQLASASPNLRSLMDTYWIIMAHMCTPHHLSLFFEKMVGGENMWKQGFCLSQFKDRQHTPFESIWYILPWFILIRTETSDASDNCSVFMCVQHISIIALHFLSVSRQFPFWPKWPHLNFPIPLTTPISSAMLGIDGHSRPRLRNRPDGSNWSQASSAKASCRRASRRIKRVCWILSTDSHCWYWKPAWGRQSFKPQSRKTFLMMTQAFRWVTSLSKFTAIITSANSHAMRQSGMLTTGGRAALGKNFLWRICLAVLAMTLGLAVLRGAGAGALASLTPTEAAAGTGAPAATAKATADAGIAMSCLAGIDRRVLPWEICHTIAPGNWAQISRC